MKTHSDEVSIAEIVAAARRVARRLADNKRRARPYVLGGLIAGLCLAFGLEAEYAATAKLIPYNTSANLGGLSGLAGIAGVRIPSGLVDQSLTPDLYPEIANTVDFRWSLLEQPIAFDIAGRRVSTRFYLDSLRRLSVFGTIAKYSIGLPRLASAAFRSRAVGRASTISDSALRRLTVEDIEALEEMERRVVVTLNRKTGVITVRSTLPDATGAAGLVDAATKLLVDRIVAFESSKAAAELAFVQRQRETAREELEDAQDRLAAFLARNRAALSPELEVAADRLRTEVSLRASVFQQLSSEVASAQIRKNQDTPSFAVAQREFVPPKRSSPNRTLTVLLALLGAGLAFALRWGSPARGSGASPA